MANKTSKQQGRGKQEPKQASTFDKLRENLAKLPKDLKL